MLFSKNTRIMTTISEKTLDTKTPFMNVESAKMFTFSDGVGVRSGPRRPSLTKPLNLEVIPERSDLKKVSVFRKPDNNNHLAAKFEEFMKNELKSANPTKFKVML